LAGEGFAGKHATGKFAGGLLGPALRGQLKSFNGRKIEEEALTLLCGRNLPSVPLKPGFGQSLLFGRVVAIHGRPLLPSGLLPCPVLLDTNKKRTAS
jgi:hypothetical protein